MCFAKYCTQSYSAYSIYCGKIKFINAAEMRIEYVHRVHCIEAIVSQKYLKHINSKFAVIILAHGI